MLHTLVKFSVLFTLHSAALPLSCGNATAPTNVTAPANVTSPVNVTAPVKVTTPAASAIQSLDAAFKAKGKQYFGTCGDKRTLATPQNAAIAISQFGQLTPENSMKWDSTEPTQGQFNFANSDYLVDFAKNNSQIVRGHALLWHSQLAPWVSGVQDAATLQAALENHVTTLVGRYAGRIAAWDIVNEIFDESGNFRTSPFHQLSKGINIEDMLKVAFNAARQADPAAKLYINDYNLDSATSQKTQAMIAKVREWRAQGIPIDGIGSQSHLNPGQAGGVKAALQALCAAAPECAITELDIAAADPSEYAAAVTACLEIENCVGVTVWGISDKDSWRTGKQALLYDDNYQAKNAYSAVLAAIS